MNLNGILRHWENKENAGLLINQKHNEKKICERKDKYLFLKFIINLLEDSFLCY